MSLLNAPLALHPLPVTGGAQGTAAATEFGKLFRQQAGANHAVLQQAMSAAPKVSEETIPAARGAKHEAEPAANNTEQAETEAALTEPEEPASANPALASATPALSLAASPNQFQPAVNEANANEARLSKTLPEAAAIPPSTIASTGESSTKSMRISDASATQASSAKHKTKEGNQANMPTPPSSTGQQTASSVVLAAAPIPTPPSAPAQAPMASASPQWIQSADNSGADASEGPLRNAATDGHSLTPQASGRQPVTVATPSAFENAIDPAQSVASSSAGASTEADASKDFAGSLSPALHGSLTSHALHAAEQGTGGAIAAVVSSPTPAPTPTSTIASPAAVTGAANPIASVPASAATNLAPAPPSPVPGPYDKIDQGATPVVLHSGVQHVAVGVRDPELGWLEIETQNVAGHVDATLVTASGQTHASLAAQLPAMAQYLEQRDIQVGTIVVHHQAAGTNGGGSGYGSGSNESGYGPGGNGAGAQSFNHAGRGDSGEGRPAQYTSVSPAIHMETISNDDAAAYRPVSYISVRA